MKELDLSATLIGDSRTYHKDKRIVTVRQ